MSEQTKSNGNVFIGWGVFLLFFPAVGGAIFLLGTSFNFLENLLFVVAFSYIIWGWASVIAGIVLIVIGTKRNAVAEAKSSSIEANP